MDHRCTSPFEFTLPTKIVYGCGVLKQLPEEVKTDSRIEMTIRQYQLKYMVNGSSAAELMVNKKA